MSKIVVDQIQKSGAPAFTLPLADGTAGQLMATNGAGQLSFVAAPIDQLVPADSANIFGSVFSASARGNIYSTGEWTSSGPNSTYQNATAAGTNATYTHQSFNMFLGDGYPGGTTQIMYSGDFRGLEHRTIMYSGNDRLGHNQRELFYYENNTSWGGVSWHVMPVRNTTGASITRSLSFMYSSYSDAGNGAALGYYTPNAATYAGTTGGAWTQPFTASSNTITNTTASIVVPANTTVLVMLVTSHNYQTTYYFKESSMFFGLSTFFGTGLVCDLRMLNALALLRTPSATNTTSYPEQIYTGCATTYGNR